MASCSARVCCSAWMGGAPIGESGSSSLQKWMTCSGERYTLPARVLNRQPMMLSSLACSGLHCFHGTWVSVPSGSISQMAFE